jgi:uncharacterized protein (DUF2147 family)
MKNKMMLSWVILVSMVVFPSLLLGQKYNIEDYWLDEKKEGKIQIYKAKNNKYYGKITWLKEPNRDGKPKVDINNPKAAQRNNPIIDLIILKGFTFNGKDEYEGGSIYDPKSGKTYDCKITFKDENTLLIRGYMGISLIGKTTIWTRSTP